MIFRGRNNQPSSVQIYPAIKFAAQFIHTNDVINRCSSLESMAIEAHSNNNLNVYCALHLTLIYLDYCGCVASTALNKVISQSQGEDGNKFECVCN
jgi:hypothetical protein